MDTKLFTKKNAGRFLSLFFLVMFIPLLLLALPVNFASAASSPSASSIYNPQVSWLLQKATDWEQVNTNGFGDPQIGEVTALESFNGYLYAGTHNPIDPAPLYDGGQIFRSSDGTTWTAVTLPGFGNTHDIAPPAILDFVVFNNNIYASTGRGNASQIWRSSNGTTWAPMDVTGFSDPDNMDITALAVYNGKIYAGVRNQVTGAQIWSSFTGNNNEWTQVAPDAPGTVPASVTGFAEFSFDGGLYAAVEFGEGPAQIWRSYSSTWETVVNDGFGDANTLFTGGMVEFGGALYAGTGNTTVGAQLWRSADGDIWTQAISPGFGDSNNQQVESLYVFQNQLYVSVKNAATGMEIWRSADGTLWEQANLDGFGDSNNTGTNWSNATSEFLGQLYMGTSNVVDGGELWRKILPNNPPTNISLSNNTVDENQSVNTVVGILSATDLDAGNTFTFSLACAFAGADDGSFNIQGMNLRTSAVFDFETKSTHNICIRVTDQGGLTFDKNFAVSVNNLNESPTNISLSNSTVNENQPINTVVGILSATDPDAGDTFTFSLTCAAPGADDAAFNINGKDLRTSAAFDFEMKSSYRICIRSTDSGSLSTTKTFTINIYNLIDTQTFADVPTGYWAWSYVERLYASGITSGCGNGYYCPNRSVTRAEMAIFLLRSIHGSDYTPPATTGIFDDVSATFWAADWIEQLYKEGITSGCSKSPMLYCPNRSVTRAEMAIFLLRAKYTSSYTSDPATGTLFDDIPATFWAGAWVEQLYKEGITSGCSTSPMLYCPNRSITRAEMAIFLVRAFSLP